MLDLARMLGARLESPREEKRIESDAVDSQQYSDELLRTTEEVDISLNQEQELDRNLCSR